MSEGGFNGGLNEQRLTIGMAFGKSKPRRRCGHWAVSNVSHQQMRGSPHDPIARVPEWREWRHPARDPIARVPEWREWQAKPPLRVYRPPHNKRVW